MKENIILVLMVVSYSILIAIQISIGKELQEIRKILWEVARNESFNFLLKKSKKYSSKPEKESDKNI